MNGVNKTSEDNNSGREPTFSRVASIIEQARTNTVRVVNSNMVLCYWFIGREIVEELHEGQERAEYGSQLPEELSESLSRRYGKGFSDLSVLSVVSDAQPQVLSIQHFQKIATAERSR